MPQPQPYNKTTQFNEREWDQTTKSSLDIELQNIETTADGICKNLALIQRDDGALMNAVVTKDALSEEALKIIASKWTPRGSWAVNTAYATGDVITSGPVSYVCFNSHTSGASFGDDIASWQPITGIAQVEVLDGYSSWGTLTTGQQVIDLSALTPPASYDPVKKNVVVWVSGQPQNPAGLTYTDAAHISLSAPVEADVAVMVQVGNVEGSSMLQGLYEQCLAEKTAIMTALTPYPAPDTILVDGDVGVRLQPFDVDTVKSDQGALLQALYADEYQTHSGNSLAGFVPTRNKIEWSLTANSTFDLIESADSVSLVFYVKPNGHPLTFASAYTFYGEEFSSAAVEVRVCVDINGAKKRVTISNARTV